ncbi:MAG: hypothetical protein FD167_3 [bacterium]|nr:MAG: hypothetical protein FD167_3 [bacterium]
MATYVSLLYFTQKTFASIKDLIPQLDAAKAAYQEMGVNLIEAHLAMGREFDAVIICEAPNEESVMKVALYVSMQGNARIESFRIFSEAEVKSLISALP